MANPTTLQMRQQEIHRPFQPLDTTEGRVGRAIAAPQETYAGGWAVAARATDNLGPLVNQYLRVTGGLGGGKKEEDAELLTAQEYYAQATFALEDMLRTAPQEVRDSWKKEAAEHDQTTSEYLRGKADRKVQETLASLEIPYRKQYAARESILDKANLEGYQEIEKRDNKINNTLVDEAVKNGTAIRNDDGSVNFPATLEYTKKLRDATRKIIEGSKDPLKSIGITWDQYVWAQPHEKAMFDNMVFDDQKIAYNTDLIQVLQTSINYLKSGQMVPENVRTEFDILYQDAERWIQEGNFPNEALRTRLLNHLKTYKTQIDSVLSERGKTIDDMTKQLQGIQADIQIGTLLEDSEIGKMARTTTALGATVTGQLIQNNILKDLGNAAANDVATWDNATKRRVANRYANAIAIMNGLAPRYGNYEDYRATKAALDNATKRTIAAQQDWGKLSFEERNIIRNNWIDTYLQTRNALSGTKDSLGHAMEYYANYIDVLNTPETVDKIALNKDLIQMYNVDTTSQVAARVIQSSSGPAGVWRTTVESPRRKIYYDTESDKFSSHNVYSLFDKKATGTGITSPITRDESWEEAIDNLNKVYNALEASTELQLGRVINEQEKIEIRNYVINLMKASGIPNTTFVMPEDSEVKK